jgi:hypothetical protein
MTTFVACPFSVLRVGILAEFPTSIIATATNYFMSVSKGK